MKNVKGLLSAILIFSFLIPSAFSDGEKSVIKIEKAQKSEYKKDEASGSDTIILTGDVKVSVTNGGKTTTITADKINYNRANDMIYAEGEVTLEQSSSGSSGGETVTAKSLLFNTATLEGVFDNGRAIQTSSDALNLPSGSKLVVASDIFGRDSSGTVAFKSGNLTFCDDENPHWRIKASRIWLLPGGEFAFLNAVLYVGRVPLMWLPAFYYPKDELIFNPAFGYTKRSGYFFNTTTYLYGRKSNSSVKSSSSSSSDDKIDFFSLMNTSSQKEQVREGLILHNTDKDFSGDTSHYVKVMADYYANLGAMVGIDGNLSPGSYITELAFNAELGFSHTVFKNDGVYLPYNATREKVHDGANFMTFKTPFRYQANLKLSLSKPFSLSLSLPVYSDPYFDYDFNKRSESMDWIDFAMNGGKSEEDENETVSETSSFSWNLSGNYSIPVPQFLNPYISRISISNFSSSIVYSSKSATSLDKRDEAKADSAWKEYTPERKFYYPSQVNPFKISGSISGTLVKIPAASSSSRRSDIPSMIKIDEFKTDEEIQKEQEDLEKRRADRLAKEAAEKNPDAVKEEKKEPEPEAESEEIAEEKSVFDESVLPALSVPSFSAKNTGDLTYSLGYTISPDFSSQFSYASENLTSPEDFSWSDMQSTYVQVKVPTTISSTLGYKDGFLSLSDSFTFNPSFQRHPYLKTEERDSNNKSNGGYSESSIKSIKNADYGAKKLDLTNTNSLSLKPFYYTDHFSNTSLSWNSSVKMIETKYISTDPEEPEWEYLTMELWSKDCVTTHNLSANFAASEGNFSQALTLTSTLPPQNKSYHGNLNLSFPNVTFSCGTGIKEVDKTDSATKAEYTEWQKEDFSQSLSFKLFNSKLNISQSYIYDFEESESESFRLSLSGFGAQLAYTSSYVAGYEFKAQDASGNLIRDYGDYDKISKRTGWISKESKYKKFQPNSLSFAYTNSSHNFKFWSDKISFLPTISTSLVYDFLRPTSSYFVFRPGISFKINNFLDISFSAESRNSVIYRYFCPEDRYNYYYGGKGERNIFKDLKNSFMFGDKKLREISDFKMKTLNLKVSHDLDDWDFNFELSVSPRYIAASGDKKAYYDMSPYISLSVAWRPLPSMKTEIVDEYGEWQLNK